MTPSFLDTTALIDLVFKDSNTRQIVTTTCIRGARRITSQYVIYELARGFLTNLILLYNRSLSLHRFSDLVEYTNQIRRKANRASTWVKSFACYLQDCLNVGLIKAPTGVTLDEFFLKQFKGHLRRQIRHGWTEIFKCVNHIIDEVSCRKPIQPPYVDNELFRQDLDNKRCGEVLACGLKSYLRKNLKDFNTLKANLQQLPHPDGETLHRIDAIRELCNDFEKDFNGGHCYNLGDAIIIHESPPHCRVISSNRRHFEPLCDFLGRQSQCYSQTPKGKEF